MIDFFKNNKSKEEESSETLDYDATNKCDNVIKALVDNGKYICHINGNAYIRLNSVVFSLSLPSKYTDAFNRCVVTDWDSYEVIKPSYGHWTALWEEKTPSKHACHVMMEFINKAQDLYIDTVLKCAEEHQDEHGKIELSNCT